MDSEEVASGLDMCHTPGSLVATKAGQELAEAVYHAKGVDGRQCTRKSRHVPDRAFTREIRELHRRHWALWMSWERCVENGPMDRSILYTGCDTPDQNSKNQLFGSLHWLIRSRENTRRPHQEAVTLWRLVRRLQFISPRGPARRARPIFEGTALILQ